MLVLDANPSPRLIDPLDEVGYETRDVQNSACSALPDTAILERALSDGYDVVTADTDFPMLLALRRTRSPSILLPRQVAELAPEQRLALVQASLPNVVDDLERGAVFSLSPTAWPYAACPRR